MASKNIKKRKLTTHKDKKEWNVHHWISIHIRVADILLYIVRHAPLVGSLEDKKAECWILWNDGYLTAEELVILNKYKIDNKKIMELFRNHNLIINLDIISFDRH